MAKGSKKRKLAPDNSTRHSKQLKKDVSESETAFSHPDKPTLIGNLIYEEELETTTETLTLLAENPTLIGLKALKPFKTAIHEYWRVANETSLTGASPL
jgi:hypothetical protein